MPAKMHYKPEETLKRLEPEEMGLVYTSAQRLEIKGKMEIESAEEEVCLVCIDGQVDFEHDAQVGTAKKLDMIYLPIQSKMTVTSDSAVLIQFGAPCNRKTNFVHIQFEEVDGDDRHKVYGETSIGTKRDVWNYINESFDSSRFLMGICSGGNGGWTAWPPHEHGKKREEVYVYFNMGDSFGAQFVYDDMDNPHTVALIREGHLVAIPRGYHPNCGCPGGGIFYVYCMVSTTAEDRSFMDLEIQKIYGDKL